MKRYVKTPLILQMEAAECGAAALASILAYYGKHIPLEKLRIDTGVSRDGCNAANILAAAEKYCLKGNAYELDMDGLEELTLPCILHWNFSHFVVYEGKKGKNYLINDPAMGRRKISCEEMERCFTGVALEFEIQEDFQAGKKEKSLLSVTWEWFMKERQGFAVLLISGILLAIPGVLLPVLAQIFMDTFLQRGQTDWETFFFMLFLLLILFQAFWTVYRGFILNKFKRNMVLSTSFDFLYHMFRLPVNFYEQRYPGDLSERIFDNVRVCNFLAGELVQMLLDLFVAVFCLLQMLHYSLWMTVPVILGVLIFWYLVLLSNRDIENDMKKLKQEEGRMNGAVYAGVSISKTLKASGAEGIYTGKILGYYAKTMETQQNIGKKQETVKTGTEVFPVIFLFLELFLGSYMLFSGKISLGGITAFLILLLTFLDPIVKLFSVGERIQEFKVDLLRMDDIASYEEEERFQERMDTALVETEMEKIQGQVEVRNLTFGYSRLNPPVVKNLSFFVECGTSLAITGKSGSGKSTLSRVLGGLYRPWYGQILIDGKPIDRFSIDALRAGIGVVSQDATLFSGTIWENLSMWNPAVKEKDIVQAAMDACIHEEIIRKPGAYRYMVKENGANLSGGEKQRLEIARALSKNPAILILDEATSALDSLTEKQILDNIKRRGCTCIVIAHRVSAVRDCKQVFVMENGEGRLASVGTQEVIYDI